VPITANTQGKPQPTDKQVSLAADAIQLWKKSDATLTFEMDEDGTMLLNIEEDGGRCIGRFDVNGFIVGDWIW